MATVSKYKNAKAEVRYRVRHRFINKDGKITQTDERGFRTKREAEIKAHSIEVDKRTGKYVAHALGQVTVGELGPDWLARQVHHKPSWSVRLESIWRVHIEPKWGQRRIGDILKTEVQTWVSEMPLSPSSVRHAHTVLAGILDDAVSDRRISSNPARGVKFPRKIDKTKNYLSAAQVRALAEESKHPDIVLLLATTGLRWGEMAALRARDVDLGRSRIRVERSASKVNSETIIGTTKNHAARSVAVSTSVIKLLAPAMVAKSPDELLWTREDGKPLRPPTTTHWFGAAVKRCQAADPNFPRVTVHELRHTAASLMITQGANVKAVQSQLGHKTATMTLDQYGHLFPDDLDDLANKMDDLLAGP